MLDISLITILKLLFIVCISVKEGKKMQNTDWNTIGKLLAIIGVAILLFL